MSKISRNLFYINRKNLLGSTRNPNFLNLRLSSSDASHEYDMVVVGGGIVGAATARELSQRHPSLKMAILEKEAELAQHQTGHNSGVIHAGIYYKPGSLKAKLCVEGMHLMYDYCNANNIPYKKVGKLIVATNAIEQKRLADLHQRAIQNQVPDLKVLKGQDAIRTVEPYCKGVEALWSPHTGIVDFKLVTQHYAKDFKENGGKIFLNYEVNGFQSSQDKKHPVTITGSKGQTIHSKYVLTCGGLQSDLISEMSGCNRDPRIVPFRGEYLLLNPKKCHMIKGNIYPVPDPRFPFLGVHFTPRMDGSVWLGPNAVLALKREGYTWFDVNLKEFADSLSYPGFRKLASKYVGYGAKETLKSILYPFQVKDLQKYISDISISDVSRGPGGVRAQALDADGNLVEDFVFDLGKSNLGERILHCRNAPSPGATSSLAIAKMVADKLQDQFNLNKI